VESHVRYYDVRHARYVQQNHDAYDGRVYAYVRGIVGLGDAGARDGVLVYDEDACGAES